ncbi:metal ABC transporter substrate-binding protein [Halorubrum sp. SY-15]|uniref:metal ABC transporter substrate-binding protein n=1 Tax=Halorubrum sp. SY-15 TaxID=3402277 RepID=UPI003EB7A6EE
MAHSRRAVLKRGTALVTAGAAASMAGCTGDATSSGGGAAGGFEEGYAAFFTLHDWTSQVAGDRVAFTDPVDVGQLGHGWEPDGDLVADVAATDAFVYLDSPEFAWAQDVASTLEADYDGVAVVDALAGVEDDLLAWDHDHGAEGEHDSAEVDDHSEGDGHDHAEKEDHDHAEEDDHDHAEEEDHDHAEEDGHDHAEEDGHDHAEEEDGHDHGGTTQYDPHAWVDPVLAGDMVDTIADGLGAADPDNAEAYADNATAYIESLDSVHEAFERIAANATRDVAVLAGHNSFQYLEARYGFRLHSPVGVSPQNEPSGTQIAETVGVVDDEGIDTILYDRFESPRLAETIVENSDATRTMAVSPAGGTIAEWNDAGYGYLEQMTEINVPAFERAFGAQ